MTETTQTPAPTLAQLLTARADAWANACNAAIPHRAARQAAYHRAATEYDDAVIVAAFTHPDITDEERAILNQPPAKWSTEQFCRKYSATLENWRAIVHPQEFDAQPEN